MILLIYILSFIYYVEVEIVSINNIIMLLLKQYFNACKDYTCTLLANVHLLSLKGTMCKIWPEFSLKHSKIN